MNEISLSLSTESRSPSRWKCDWWSGGHVKQVGKEAIWWIWNVCSTRRGGRRLGKVCRVCRKVVSDATPYELRQDLPAGSLCEEEVTGECWLRVQAIMGGSGRSQIPVDDHLYGGAWYEGETLSITPPIP